MDPQGLDRFGRFLQRRTLRALASRLQTGEQVLAAVEATLDRPGVLAATDRRLLFVRRTWLGARSRAWPYARITRTNDRDAATLTVQGHPNAVTFTAVPKGQAKEFLVAVSQRPPRPGELMEFAMPAAEAARRKRLERLDRMLARGSLTRKEYEVAKANLVVDDDSD